MIQKLKIGTFNVNSVSVRSSHLFEILDEHEPDLFFLQELKCEEKKFPEEILNHEKYKIFYNCQKAYNGVAILIKNDFIKDGVEVKKDFDFDLSHEARYLEIKMKIFNKKFLFASIYVPNGFEIGSEKFHFKMIFLTKLKEYLKKMNQEVGLNIIIGGDFNIAPYEIDLKDASQKQNSIGFSEAERKAIREIFDLGFFDVFRILNPAKQEFSWFDYRGGSFEKNDGMRIDYILSSKTVTNFASSSMIESKWRGFSKPSDHLPVFAEFSFGT
jgi:exodeoxyribonuclease-3